MEISFANVQVSAVIGVAGLKQIDTLTFCEDILGQDNKQARRFIKSVGFEKTRVMPEGVTACDGMTEGARSLLTQMQLEPEAIDGLITVTQTPDTLVPAIGYILQERLSLKSDCLIFDLTQGCPGFVLGLFQAAQLVSAGICSKVLLCCGDVSRSMRLKRAREQVQPASLGLFGDGVGVALISRADKGTLHFAIDNDGKYHEVIKEANMGYRYLLSAEKPNIDEVLNGTYIDGTVLADYVLERVKSNVEHLLAKAGMSYEELSYCVAHQANRTLLNALAMVAKMPAGFMPFLAKDSGNASSASIPLALSECHESLPELRNKPALLSGFGVGMAVASVIADLRDTRLLSPLYL